VTDFEISKRRLSSGWRVGEPYTVSKQEDYVKRMVEETLKGPRPGPVIPTTIQAKSTQATLDRDPKDDAKHIERLFGPMPEGWKAVPDADMETEEGRAKGVAKRELGIDEVLLIEDTRRKPKNSVGQQETPTLTPEAKQRAVEAFTYSKPADLSLEPAERLKNITKLEEIVNTPLEPEPPKKKGLWTRLWGSAKGYHDDWDWVEDGKGGRIKVKHDAD